MISNKLVSVIAYADNPCDVKYSLVLAEVGQLSLKSRDSLTPQEHQRAQGELSYNPAQFTFIDFFFFLFKKESAVDVGACCIKEMCLLPNAVSGSLSWSCFQAALYIVLVTLTFHDHPL